MFASIPLSGLNTGDRIVISIMSYDGLVTKEFEL